MGGGKGILGHVKRTKTERTVHSHSYLDYCKFKAKLSHKRVVPSETRVVMTFPPFRLLLD